MSQSAILSAWSPDGFRFFCLAVALSVLTVEMIKSVVDLVPGELVNFIVYNSYGFLVFNICLYCGRTVYHRKFMWFLNGFLCSAVFMLWYASQFNMGKQSALPAVYGVELLVTIIIGTIVRKYEHPKHYEDLAKFRAQVVPVQVIARGRALEQKTPHTNVA